MKALRAALRAREASASPAYSEAEGRNVSVVAPDRFYDDGKSEPVARPWEAKNLKFGQLAGATVATESLAQWHLPSGTFVYWRGRPTRIEYRYGNRA